MGAYLLRRSSYMLLVLLIVSFLAFAVVQLQPGSCGTANATSIGAQYARWLGQVLQGSLGTSCANFGTPVTDILLGGGAWSRSLILAVTAFFLSWGIGVPLGLYAALRRNKPSDHLIRLLSTFSLALPPFLIALFLALLLYMWGLSPSGGVFSREYMDLPWNGAKFVDGALHLLPLLLIVVLAQWPMITRYMRASLLDTLNQPFVQVARAKGLGERQVNYKHALRNALHPLIGLIGFWLPNLFESTLAAAYVMNYPTVELNLWNAIPALDHDVIAAGIVLFGGILMVGNLLADVALAWADPRVRYE